MSYSSEVLADSPLVYLKLDETSGSVASDSSGNARHAAYGVGNTLGSTSLLADGTGHSVGLTADTSNGVAMTSATWMNVSAFTAEALVNFSSAVDASNGDAIVCRYGAGGFQWLVWRNTAGKLALQINNATSGFQNIADTATVTLGTTYHVVATWDGTTAKFYVNGVSVGTPVTTAGALASSTQALTIGAYSNSVATVPGALIDEVSFTGSAISGSRITARYTAATTAPTTGSITLSGSAAGKARATASGSLTLAGTATGSGPSSTTATGSLTLSGTAVALPLWVTDTTNALDGLDITFTASTSVERPPAAVPSGLVLAEKYDKAIAYPQPVMDNGRPT